MKTTRKVWASFVALCAACLLHAADMKPVSRVIAISEIETEDATSYATWIAQYNAVVKAKFGVDNYVRVYETIMDGHKTGAVRAVAAASSVAELTKINQGVETDPAMVAVRDRLRGVRKFGGRTLYQAVRFDGSNKNGANYTTRAVITDEAAYLKALDQLRTLFDNVGLKDAKINAYRVIAGRTDHTHHIAINCPNVERLAVFLDLAATNAQLNEWIASVAKIRTVVTNSTSREITK
jgi:hypothetical protein